ncbi:hypothetical protein KJ855_00660 [Patescibacteria group bacterium]|nr:hypothetical protein [Patescibacteria group bacterium]
MENKTCEQCSADFVVADDDLELLDKVSPEFAGKRYLIPPPNICPHCREQRRMVLRNERALYKTKCYLCGEEKILIYSPDKNLKACCNECFWSDKWDPVDQGRDYNFSRPFFEQFAELFKDSKLWGLLGVDNENSDYCNYEKNSKDCYLNYGGGENQDCYYNTYCFGGQDNIDNYWVMGSQGLYECVNCDKCYSSKYLFNCDSCHECHYCRDCVGCNNCFGCIGLRHKEYHFFNQPLSKEDYDKRLAEYLNTIDGQNKAIKEAESVFAQHPRRFAKMTGCENCTGDVLANCINAKNAFLSTDVEDSKNINVVFDGRDLMDIFSFGEGELCYNVSSSGYSFSRCANIFGCMALNDCFYNIYCLHGKHLFGCVGLHRKEYCILNKQYTKEEYEELAPKIIDHMIKTGEWGEYFPLALSPFGYNETIANDYYPRDREQVKEMGMKWQDDEEDIQTNADFYVPHEDIRKYDPTLNPDAEQEINKCTSGILRCEVSGRLFKIMPRELRQYIKMGIPVPTKHPEVRHEERFSRMNPRKLWRRQCDCGENNHGHEGICSNRFETTYAPKRSEKIYCEGCYSKSVIQ